MASIFMFNNKKHILTINTMYSIFQLLNENPYNYMLHTYRGMLHSIGNYIVLIVLKGYINNNYYYHSFLEI